MKLNETEADKAMILIERLTLAGDARELGHAYRAQQAREKRIYWECLDQYHLTLEQWYAFEAMQTHLSK